MKTLLFFAIICIAITANAQKVTRQEVYKNKLAYIWVDSSISFDEQDHPVDTFYILTARNDKYTHIMDLFTQFSGTKDELINFIEKCIEFQANEAEKTSKVIEDHNVILESYCGTKYLYIFSKYDNDFHVYSVKHLNSILKALKNEM